MTNLKNLSRVEKENLARAIAEKKRRATKQKCLDSFYFFFTYFWDILVAEKYIYNWHMEMLCDELQIVGERVIKRQPKLYDLIINIPPGQTKSTIISQSWNAWLIAKDDTIRMLSASYSSTIATANSSKTKDIIESDRFVNLFGDLIRKDSTAKSHFYTKNGGERYSMGARGTVTGFHYHVHVVDDPLNQGAAKSSKQRNMVNSFMTDTLPSRVIDADITPLVLVMQRLHVDDPTGHLLSKAKEGVYRQISLPAFASDDTEVKPKKYYKLYKEGFMNIHRLGKSRLDTLQNRLPSSEYNGQYLQTPVKQGGNLWKEDYFIPISIHDFPKHKLKRLGTDWDLAYTEDEENSGSAFVEAGLIDQNTMLVTDLGFDWLEFPDLLKLIKRRKEPHFIEGKASGKSAVQTLKEDKIRAVEVQVQGDKEERTSIATEYGESMQIYIYDHLLDKLLNDDMQGILAFPLGKNDDLNDALVQSINRLLKIKALSDDNLKVH